MKNRHPDCLKYKKEMAAKRAKFVASIDIDAKQRIVEGWIKEHSSEKVGEDRSENEKQLSMCMSEPDLGWELILRISESTENKYCLSRLGSWHIEEWLARHGETVIDRVENMASSNIKFRRLLSCVYPNSMPENVYARVKGAALYDGFFNK